MACSWHLLLLGQARLVTTEGVSPRVLDQFLISLFFSVPAIGDFLQIFIRGLK